MNCELNHCQEYGKFTTTSMVLKNDDLHMAAVATILPAADMHVGETAVSPHATDSIQTLIITP